MSVLIRCLVCSARLDLLTLDEAPARPFDSCGHQDSRTVVLRPSEASLGLHSKAPSTGHLRSLRSRQIDYKVVKVDVQILVYQNTFGRLRSNWSINCLDITICPCKQVRA